MSWLNPKVNIGKDIPALGIRSEAFGKMIPKSTEVRVNFFSSGSLSSRGGESDSGFVFVKKIDKSGILSKRFTKDRKMKFENEKKNFFNNCAMIIICTLVIL